MTYPRLRLAVALMLFFGWLGYLVFLVVRTRDPVILARPQFLDAECIVVAEIKEKDGRPAPEVTVKEMLWANDPKLALATLRLDALTDVRAEHGWRGPGDYILPLRKTGDAYDLAFLLWSPGYVPLFQVELIDAGENIKEVAEKTKRSEEDLKKASPKTPLLLRNLPFPVADALETLGAKTRGRRPGEYRIYRATDDARAQVRRIKGGD